MPLFLIACAGFLVGILTMDLLFDVQILRLPGDQALAVISTYYKNATIDAYPLNRVIGLTMLITVAGALYEVVCGRVDRRLAVAAAAVAVVPVGLALARVLPNAILLGSRSGSVDEGIALARAILFDHLLCLAFMLTFMAIQMRVAVLHQRSSSAMWRA